MSRTARRACSWFMSANFYISTDIVHRLVIEAMFDGCPMDKQLYAMTYRPSDVACIFGVYKSKVSISWHRGAIIRKHEADGSKIIICETGYLKRGNGENNYYAVGLGGLNDNADFRNKDMPSDRFEELDIEIKPWRNSGSHVLICGQVPWDASVDHIDFKEWQRKTVAKLKTLTDRQLVFRQHPFIDPMTKPLKEDLNDCWAVVTFNSNSAVEAAVAGIPVFVSDKGTMAGPIANWHLEDIENPQMPDREQWLNDLAYCQWTPAEMRKGLAWEHLFRSH